MPRPVWNRKPPGRAIVERWDFGVDSDALGDDELRDRVIQELAALPADLRRAVRIIAAAPVSERLKIVDDIDDAADQAQANLPLARAR